MSGSKIKLELNGRTDQRMTLDAEEAKIDATDPNLVHVAVETRGATEITVNHSGVDISIGKATDNPHCVRVTVIDSHGRVRSLEFDCVT